MTQEPQKKKPSELNDQELAVYAQEIEAIIAGLSELEPAGLTPADQEARQQAIDEAIELGGIIVCEQIDRAMTLLQKKMAALKTQFDSKKTRSWKKTKRQDQKQKRRTKQDD